MMRAILILLLGLLVTSCSETNKKKKSKNTNQSIINILKQILRYHQLNNKYGNRYEIRERQNQGTIYESCVYPMRRTKKRARPEAINFG